MPPFLGDITITNCQVSGYGIGTLLSGTYDRSTTFAPDGDGPTGRIKFGTESNGGFRNITIANCIFVHCNGLAIESVDGAIIEDVTISNIAMEHITNPPIFVPLRKCAAWRERLMLSMPPATATRALPASSRSWASIAAVNRVSISVTWSAGALTFILRK